MRQILIVAKTTFKEGLRKKFLFSLFLICFFLFVASLLLGQLSLDEQVRLTINFGLGAIQISLLLLAVLLGNDFISGDLEKNTLLTLFIRPLRPFIFFLGRYLGLALLLFVSTVVLFVLLSGFFLFLSIPISGVYLIALFGMFLESLLFLAFVLFFASYSSSFLVLMYSFSLFLIGHFLDSLSYFVKEGEGIVSFLILNGIKTLPNLERVNWKSEVVYGDVVLFSEVALSSLYICCWIVFILSLACLFMEKREYY